jgi:hypothetical protein
MPGYCADVSNKDLVAEFDQLEAELHAVGRLRNLTSAEFQQFARTSRLFILVNFTSGPREGNLEAEGFADTATAAARYSELEAEHQGVADVVLVGSSQQDSIKLAYTNYFSDASGFLSRLDAGLFDLRNPT